MRSIISVSCFPGKILSALVFRIYGASQYLCMDDVSEEKFGRYPPDARRKPPEERMHRHSRGEKKGHSKDPDEEARQARLKKQYQQRIIQENIKEAFSGKQQDEETNEEDLTVDSQAQKEAQRAARGYAGHQDGRGISTPLSGEALRQAKAEARRERTLKFFGREKRKVIL